MKLKALRTLAGALALCACMTACSTVPATSPTVDTSAYRAVTYSQESSLSNGELVYITGTPDYSDIKSSASGNLFALRTADGIWYVSIGKASVTTFQAVFPAQQMKLYGSYSGALSEDDALVLDIQSGVIETSSRRVSFTSAFSASTQTGTTQQTGTTTTEEQPASSTSKPISSTVYVAGSGNGKCYHSSPNCSNMKNPRAISLSEAQKHYKRCTKCF